MNKPRRRTTARTTRARVVRHEDDWGFNSDSRRGTCPLLSLSISLTLISYEIDWVEIVRYRWDTEWWMLALRRLMQTLALFSVSPHYRALMSWLSNEFHPRLALTSPAQVVHHILLFKLHLREELRYFRSAIFKAWRRLREGRERLTSIYSQNQTMLYLSICTLRVNCYSFESVGPASVFDTSDVNPDRVDFNRSAFESCSNRMFNAHLLEKFHRGRSRSVSANR